MKTLDNVCFFVSLGHRVVLLNPKNEIKLIKNSIWHMAHTCIAYISCHMTAEVSTARFERGHLHYAAESCRSNFSVPVPLLDTMMQITCN